MDTDVALAGVRVRILERLPKRHEGTCPVLVEVDVVAKVPSR